MNLDNFMVQVQTFLTGTMINIIIGIVALVVGLMIIGWVTKIIKKALDKSKLDDTLKPFLVSLASISLKILLVLAIYGQLGGETISFVAIIGAASLAIGLAFQGALSNLAGGFLLLSLRPFHVGDYIEVSGHQGVVEAIHIFNTIIITVDNRVISVPNGQVSNASIINYTERPERRVDLTFGVGYECDLKMVVKTLEKVAADHALVLSDPAPFIKLAEHADSSLNFTVRLWCKTEDYWTVYFDIIDQVKTAFDANDISIPYPQVDVHMDK